MKEVVLSVLDQPAIRRIAFSFGPIMVNAMSFEPVKTALNETRITVVYSSKLGANRAKYSFTNNRFTLGFRSASGNLDREALIAHEATHAALDAVSNPRSVKQSEAAAYILQCLYFYYRNESAFQDGAQPTFADPILRAAWSVSQICRRRTQLTDDEVEPLFDAIAQHSLYRGREDDEEAFDGV